MKNYNIFYIVFSYQAFEIQYVFYPVEHVSLPAILISHARQPHVWLLANVSDSTAIEDLLYWPLFRLIIHLMRSSSVVVLPGLLRTPEKVSDDRCKQKLIYSTILFMKKLFYLYLKNDLGLQPQYQNIRREIKDVQKSFAQVRVFEFSSFLYICVKTNGRELQFFMQLGSR